MRLQSRRRLCAFALAGAILVLRAPGAQQRFDPGPAQAIAPGIDLYHSTDQTVLEGTAEPISIWMLRLDPARCRLRAALANDEIVGTETVGDLAARHGAAAAVNAGFFLPNGDPAGVLTIDGRLVSDTRRARGAVALPAADGALAFARLRATATLAVHGPNGAVSRVTIDGIDTTRARGRLMLFTPAYHEDTDTAEGGVEWVLAGAPLRVARAGQPAARTPIPKKGFVISYGGLKPPPPLASLKRGSRVSIDVTYEPLEGPADPWHRARDIVGGAGLLVRAGVDVDDWAVEQFTRGFAEMRHPRTMIGVRADGSIWLVTVDGRQPQLSVGMTLVELRSLARRLELTDALNLDGGGSTTMWARGAVVNSPSDATGPRKVSDALLVFTRGES